MLNYEDLIKTKDYLLQKIKGNPKIAVILGSGLGFFAKKVEVLLSIPYKEIPGFTPVGVEGHKGELIYGRIEGKEIVILSGRVHYYEGVALEKVTYPVRVLSLIGVKLLIITNAAGGITKGLKQGDIMVIKDHINLMGTNPLLGEGDPRFGQRFVDMSEPYEKKMMDIFKNSATQSGIKIKEGVYCALSGPSYETPAEINMLRIIGADAVGMSTVPEVIVARKAGLKVLGISLITNLAAGISKTPLSHEEVKEAGRKEGEKFSSLLYKFISRLGENEL